MKQNRPTEHQNCTATRVSSSLADREDPPRGASADDVRRLRPLRLLQHLATASQPLTLGQLAGLMSVPKSTLMRLLDSMEANGYVLQVPAQRGYVAGSRSVELSLQILQGTNVRRDCRGVLRKLVGKLGETCNLTVQDAGRVLYIERIETTQLLRMHLDPGTWVPMHCTASGKLFLASMPLAERRHVLAQLALNRHSPRTITDPVQLERELDEIAKRGIGVDNEEFVGGMIAVAVPVRNEDGRVVAAIACHAPTARVSLFELYAGVRHMREAADEAREVLFGQY